ncbi:MAG TPA: AAA family ATPase [Stellaceae bacterium]|nr:AAA family ATPase [Stellaceae bacterium]
MYERFFGLFRPPFAVTPDPSLMYMSRAHREALATIIYGIETRKGFVVCTGEVGTGKTTVVRAFFDQARAEAFKIVYLFTPQVSPLEMSRYICHELDIAEPDSVFAAVPVLQLKLLEIFEGGRTVVLMIDEAQLLPPETLEFLRLLSNFETDTEKLIQIVLVGQPEVDAVLARRDMRQVAQRVALRARLGALSPEEAVDYIEYRLVACGARELGQVLSESAAWTIAEAAGGIPRCINILADNVLIAGFGAGQRPVGSPLAAVTTREFASNSDAPRPTRVRRFGLRRRRPHGFDPQQQAPSPMAVWREAGGALPEMIAPVPAAPASANEPDTGEPAAFAASVPVIEPESQPQLEPETNGARPHFLGRNLALPLRQATPAPSPARPRSVRRDERFRLAPNAGNAVFEKDPAARR